MKLSKITALLLAVVIVATLCCACGGGETATSSDENTSASPSGEVTSVGDNTGTVATGDGDEINFTGYVVVKPRYASSFAVQTEVDNLIKTIKEKLGVDVVTVKDNTEAIAGEIILSGAARDGVTEISDLESYSVSVKNGKIYLLGGTDRATMAAVNVFTQMIASGEKIVNGLSKTGTYAEAEKSFSTSAMKRVWGDDFSGNDIDRKLWSTHIMNAADITSELSERTYKVANGEIELYSFTATKEDLAKDPKKKYYTPLFLCTNGVMEFQYGIFEIKSVVPFYYGNSGAFWFCATEHTANGYRSEIDMVELLGSENNVVSNLHTWGTGHTSFDNQIKREDRSHTFESEPEQLRQEYHSYFLNWTEDFIDFGTDSEVYYHADLTAEGASQFADPSKLDLDAFRLPVYIILSEFLYTPERKLGWGLNGDEDDFFYTMKIDHCDIYQPEYYGQIIYK